MEYEICPYCQTAIHWKHLFSHNCTSRFQQQAIKNRTSLMDSTVREDSRILSKRCDFFDLGCTFVTTVTSNLKLHISQCPYGKVSSVLRLLKEELFCTQQVLQNVHQNACNYEEELKKMKNLNDSLNIKIKALTSIINNHIIEYEEMRLFTRELLLTIQNENENISSYPNAMNTFNEPGAFKNEIDFNETDIDSQILLPSDITCTFQSDTSDCCSLVEDTQLDSSITSNQGIVFESSISPSSTSQNTSNKEIDCDSEVVSKISSIFKNEQYSNYQYLKQEFERMLHSHDQTIEKLKKEIYFRE